LEGGAVLQMDQAAPAHQVVLWDVPPNAVKTQIWIAISVYLLVAIAKKRFHIPGSLYTILQIIEVNVFEKSPLNHIVNKALKQRTETSVSNQLNLFDS